MNSYHWHAVARLTLDRSDSNGHEARSIDPKTDRLMAFSLKSKGIWYGFVLSAISKTILSPEISFPVRLSFLDEQGAKNNLPLHTSILFGDGVCSRGIIIIDEYFNSDSD